MTTILGIDEAGRGPVIGPLVIAGVLIEESDQDRLKNLGVKDSKQLSQLQRERFFDLIKDTTKFKILIIPPKVIDEALNSKISNLNWMEADASINIIDSLNPDRAILDSPSNNVKKYREYVAKKIANKTEIIAENKADEIYPVVGAASILAKVTRDSEIDKLKKEFKVDFGSGYPSDPVTVEFLKNNFNKYDFFRKTWKSYKNVAEKKDQKNIGDF